MTLLRELEQEARAKTVDLSVRQLDALRDNFLDVSNRAVVFLSLILAIGLVGVVALARGLTPAPHLYAVALACFLAGLVAVAILNALNFEISRIVLLRVAKMMGRIFRSELPVEAAQSPPVQPAWAYVTSSFGYIALLLWMCGAAAAYQAFTANLTLAGAPSGAIPPVSNLGAAVSPAGSNGTQSQEITIASRPKSTIGWSLGDKIATLGEIVGFLQFAALIATYGVMKNTARRQLRAYISPASFGLVDGTLTNPPQPHRQNVPGVVVEMKNFGQTPGYRTVSWAEVTVIEPINEEKLIVPEIQESFAQTLPPNGVSTKSRWFSRQLTTAEIADVQNGVRAIYIYGRIEYLDVYRTKRYSNFRVAYTGAFPPTGGTIFNFSSRGNEAD